MYRIIRLYVFFNQRREKEKYCEREGEEEGNAYERKFVQEILRVRWPRRCKRPLTCIPNAHKEPRIFNSSPLSILSFFPRDSSSSTFESLNLFVILNKYFLSLSQNSVNILISSRLFIYRNTRRRVLDYYFLNNNLENVIYRRIIKIIFFRNTPFLFLKITIFKIVATR